MFVSWLFSQDFWERMSNIARRPGYFECYFGMADVFIVVFWDIESAQHLESSAFSQNIFFESFFYLVDDTLKFGVEMLSDLRWVTIIVYLKV